MEVRDITGRESRWRISRGVRVDGGQGYRRTGRESRWRSGILRGVRVDGGYHGA